MCFGSLQHSVNKSLQYSTGISTRTNHSVQTGVAFSGSGDQSFFFFLDLIFLDYRTFSHPSFQQLCDTIILPGCYKMYKLCATLILNYNFFFFFTILLLLFIVILTISLYTSRLIVYHYIPQGLEYIIIFLWAYSILLYSSGRTVYYQIPPGML